MDCQYFLLHSLINEGKITSLLIDSSDDKPILSYKAQANILISNAHT